MQQAAGAVSAASRPPTSKPELVWNAHGARSKPTKESSLFSHALREPPSNVVAEMALLGALLANNRALERCPGLQAEHFVGDRLGDVFAAISDGVAAGRVVDCVSLKGLFDNGLLASLLSAMVGIINVSTYADEIIQCAQRRDLIEIGERMVNEGHSASVPLRDALASATDALDRIIDRRGSLSMHADTAVERAIEAMEAARDRAGLPGVATGFHGIDARWGGLEAGKYYVLAGRPGMGKSALALKMATNIARRGDGIYIASQEMTCIQLGQRVLAVEAGVPLRAIRMGSTTVEQCSRIVKAQRELRGMPMTISDLAGQTVSEIIAGARVAKRKHGLKVAVVDHLHITARNHGDARENETVAVGHISTALKEASKSLDCAFLVAAQLSRGVEGREDKRPTLSDLRQAGGIEQDADVVGFVYRPEYYLANGPAIKPGELEQRKIERQHAWEAELREAAGRCEVISAKVRDGETGMDLLRWQGWSTSFTDWE